MSFKTTNTVVIIIAIILIVLVPIVDHKTKTNNEYAIAWILSFLTLELSWLFILLFNPKIK